MMLEVGLADHRRHDDRMVALARDAGERDGGIVDREGQVLFERERHHLMQAARVLERQIEQALGDEIGRQRGDDDVGLTGFGDQARERAAEIGFVVGANLVVHAGRA